MSLQSQRQNPLKQRSLRQLVDQLEHHRHPHSQRQKGRQKQILIDVNEMRDHLKQSWKGGDKGNRQFGQLQVLKNRILNSWQIQRLGLSQRSYSTPKQSPGYKFTTISKQFSIKDQKQLHSKPFSNYLSKIQKEYQNNLFKNDRYQNRNREILSKLSATSMKFAKSNSFFGCTERGNSFKTFKSFKSEILAKQS